MLKKPARVARKILDGGKRPGAAYKSGYWYEPTVLTNVRQNMQIMQEEVFGPVIPIMQFDDFERALTWPNDSSYGLAAYLFTNDMNRILRAVRDMEVGELYINRGPANRFTGSTPDGSRAASAVTTANTDWKSICNGRPSTSVIRDNGKAGAHGLAFRRGASFCPAGRTAERQFLCARQVDAPMALGEYPG